MSREVPGRLGTREFRVILDSRVKFSKEEIPGTDETLEEFSSLTHVPANVMGPEELFLSVDDEGYFVAFNRDLKKVAGPLDLNGFADAFEREKNRRVDPEGTTVLIRERKLIFAFEAQKKSSGGRFKNHQARLVMIDLPRVKDLVGRTQFPTGGAATFFLPDDIPFPEGLAAHEETGVIAVANQDLSSLRLATFEKGKLTFGPSLPYLRALEGTELGDLTYVGPDLGILTKGLGPAYNLPELHLLRLDGKNKGGIDPKFLTLQPFLLPQAEGVTAFIDPSSKRLQIAFTTEPMKHQKENELVIIEEIEK